MNLIRKTMAMKLIELVSFDFTTGRLLDRLEDFDMKVSEYERESKEEISDNMRNGIAIKGMKEKGSLREHLLLHSERCATYTALIRLLEHKQHDYLRLHRWKSEQSRKSGSRGNAATVGNQVIRKPTVG